MENRDKISHTCNCNMQLQVVEVLAEPKHCNATKWVACQHFYVLMRVKGCIVLTKLLGIRNHSQSLVYCCLVMKCTKVKICLLPAQVGLPVVKQLFGVCTL